MEAQPQFFERHAILLSKLRCPLVGASWLVRQKLKAKLNDGYQKSITLVQAPAGYGKTTAIAQWFSAHVGPKGWIALDELDNDFPKFISYVYALLQHSEQDFQPAPLFDDWSKISAANSEQIIAFFCAHLSRYQQRPVIVLDDFHWITDTALVHCIERLLKHISQLANIVLISRTAPPLNLHEHLLANQVMLVNSDDLKFTDIETRDFFAQYDDQLFASFTPSLDDISGWPAGLQLFRMARENQLPMSQEQALLSDYIFSEIIRQMPEPWLSATLRAAVSRRFNRQLLATLWPALNIDSLLDVLEKKYRFITMTGHDDRWYRFHSLFRQALIEHFRRIDPSGYIVTERRCAHWWLQKAYYSEAAEHLLNAGDEADIASFLEAHGWSFYRNGQYQLLASCFKNLSLATIAENANLTLTYAWLSLMNEDPLQADQAILKAEKMLPNVATHRASLFSVKSVIAVIFDDYFAAQHWAERSLAESTPARPWERCHSFLANAEARLNQCDFAGAAAALNAANQICQREKYTTLLIQVLYLDADIHASLGQWQAAQQKLEMALKFARERGLSKLFSIDHLQRTYARILRLQGQFSAAHRVLSSVDLSQHPLGDYWRFPILIEQLLSLMLSEPKDLDKISGMAKKITILMSTSQYSVKWQLAADRALVLYWAHIGEDKSLRALINRYESVNFQTPRFTLNARFNVAMALFACGDLESAALSFSQCSEGAQLVDYIELHLLCRVMNSIVCQHRQQFDRATELRDSWRNDVCANSLVQSLSDVFNRYIPARAKQANLEAPVLLTKTEQKVQELLLKDLPNKVVAQRLGVTIATVRSHIKAINRKRRLATDMVSDENLI